MSKDNPIAIKILPIITICFLMVTSCKDGSGSDRTNTQQNEKIKISGKAFGNYKRVTFINYRTQVRYKSEISDKGNYEVAFHINSPGTVTLMFGGVFTPVFVKPGSKIKLTVNTTTEEPFVKFKGNLAAENSFLWKRNKNRFKQYQRPDYSQPVDSFTDIIKERYTKAKREANEYKNKVKEMDFDPAFVEYTTEADQYGNLSSMLSLISSYAYNNQKKEDRVKKILQFNIQPYFDGVEIERPELLDNQTYTRFLKVYLNYMQLKKQGAEVYEEKAGNRALLNNLALLKSNIFQNPEIKSYFAYVLAKRQLKRYRLTNSEPILDYYKKHNDVKIYRRRIEGLLANIHSTNKGETIKNYTFVNVDGETISINDFKGSYIFIDLWATWCKPCRVEQTYLFPLVKKYNDENIAFLSISVDYKRDWDEWEKEIHKEDPPGVQLLAKNHGRHKS